MDINSNAVTAALDVLRENFDLGGSAKVSNYIWEGQTSEHREQGLRRLKEADLAAETQVRSVVAKAVIAAIEVLNKEKKAQIS